jgi:uncharacterized protein (DUF1778 family)
MKNPVIATRMPEQEIKLIRKIASARGEDLSAFLRRAVYKELAELSFLSEERKKALGLTPVTTRRR